MQAKLNERGNFGEHFASCPQCAVMHTWELHTWALDSQAWSSTNTPGSTTKTLLNLMDYNSLVRLAVLACHKCLLDECRNEGSNTSRRCNSRRGCLTQITESQLLVDMSIHASIKKWPCCPGRHKVSCLPANSIGHSVPAARKSPSAQMCSCYMYVQRKGIISRHSRAEADTAADTLI